MPTVAATFPLPTVASLQELLDGLLGREITVSPGTPFDPRPPAAFAVGGYIDADDVVGATCVVDLELAAASGAALALIPADQATAAVRQGTLPPSIAENVYEILNVAASLFNTLPSRHLRLRDVALPPDTVADDVADVALSPADRLDLRVDVEGYGAGGISFCVR